MPAAAIRRTLKSWSPESIGRSDPTATRTRDTRCGIGRRSQGPNTTARIRDSTPFMRTKTTTRCSRSPASGRPTSRASRKWCSTGWRTTSRWAISRWCPRSTCGQIQEERISSAFTSVSPAMFPILPGMESPLAGRKTCFSCIKIKPS